MSGLSDAVSRRSVISFAAAGVVFGVVWQLLSPYGVVPGLALPLPGGDTISAGTDGLFALLAGVGGLAFGTGYVISVAKPEVSQAVIVRWVAWLVLGCLAVGIAYLVGRGIAVAAHKPASGRLTSVAPAVVWPFLFSITTSVGSFLSVIFAPARRRRPSGQHQAGQQ